VNNKALLPHRDTKSTMTFSTFIARNFTFPGRDSGLPQVSKPGNSTHSVRRYVLSACTVIEHSGLGELKPAARAAGFNDRFLC
jgi:hypothetical protein